MFPHGYQKMSLQVNKLQVFKSHFKEIWSPQCIINKNACTHTRTDTHAPAHNVEGIRLGVQPAETRTHFPGTADC